MTYLQVCLWVRRHVAAAAAAPVNVAAVTDPAVAAAPVNVVAATALEAAPVHGNAERVVATVIIVIATVVILTAAIAVPMDTVVIRPEKS